jgi:predicted lipoprotein with Yx(FWY)xxD motif
MLKKAMVPVAVLGAGLCLAASAQAAMLKVRESRQFGDYLTDGVGRALYMFSGDTQGTPHAKPKVTCIDACLQTWTPLYEGTKLDADRATVDVGMINTVTVDEGRIVTYAGWPLYYGINDMGATLPKTTGETQFGGTWYLVDPAGHPIEKK